MSHWWLLILRWLLVRHQFGFGWSGEVRLTYFGCGLDRCVKLHGVAWLSIQVFRHRPPGGVPGVICDQHFGHWTIFAVLFADCFDHASDRETTGWCWLYVG